MIQSSSIPRYKAHNFISNPAGLVAWYHFAKGSGNQLKDFSGYKNHGTINGATWGLEGKKHNLSFDGIDDYINCGNDSSLNITEAITLSMWLNIPKFHDYGNGDHSLIVKGIDYNGKYGFWIDTPSDMRVCFGVAVDEGCPCWTTNDYGQWHHLVGVKGSGKFRLYLDGVLHQETDEKTISDNINEHLFIGGSSDTAKCPEVLIDEVRIYNRALLEPEILSNFNIFKRLYNL